MFPFFTARRFSIDTSRLWTLLWRALCLNVSKQQWLVVWISIFWMIKNLITRELILKQMGHYVYITWLLECNPVQSGNSLILLFMAMLFPKRKYGSTWKKLLLKVSLKYIDPEMRLPLQGGLFSDQNRFDAQEGPFLILPTKNSSKSNNKDSHVIYNICFFISTAP